MAQIIGRYPEIEFLNNILKQKESVFLVVYGRRRVGKTFLIREAYKHSFDFHLTGLANASLADQLLNFYSELVRFNKSNKVFPKPCSWFEAFQQLREVLEQSKSNKKKIFLDEMPWLDTPKSKFISALEHFWNSWAAARTDIVLILCGSAASWMVTNLLNNKGGLHNRVTHKLLVQPFTLKETETFLAYKGVDWNRYQILETYMALGGIPYYLNGIEKGKSAAQALNQLFFSEQGLLTNEFDNLYAALFKKSDNHVAIVAALSKKMKGLSREEILESAQIANGGGATKVLQELELSGFIRKYIPFGKQVKDTLFQLVDFYSLFYFKFLHKRKGLNSDYWMNIYDTPTQKVWQGYAFEILVLMHLPQLKHALGISGIQSSIGSWRGKTNESATQIDLLIDRKDQIIDLIEMKFSSGEFIIDKKYAENLRNKRTVFKSIAKTKSAVHLVMVTPYGTQENAYATELLQHNLSMDFLFNL